MKASDKTNLPENAMDNMLNDTDGMGNVVIHENVISSLVRKAVQRVNGVSRIAGSAIVDNIAELVGSRRMQDRAITVVFGDNKRVSIEVKLNLKFGCIIPDVSNEVQRNIIEDVEKYTGMTVVKVNLVIQALEEEEKEETEEVIEPAR